MIRFLQKSVTPVVLAAVLLVAGCATTMELTAEWKDPSYRLHPHKIMVVGVARAAVNRRIFEDEFVRRLKDRGIDAIASYSVLPDALQSDRKAIADKVAQLGADAVLITRQADKKTVQTIVPGVAYYPPSSYGTWQEYYGYGYDAMFAPGYVAEEELAVVETNLYDAPSDRLVWTSTAEIGSHDPIQQRIRDYIGIVIDAMVKQGLLN